MENIIFSIFPMTRPVIERYFFNPLDFKSDHIRYSLEKFNELQENIKPYVNLNEKVLLELGPGGSIGLGLLALKNGIKKYIAIDDGTHTFINKKRLSHYSMLLKNKTHSLKKYFIEKNGRLTYNPESISFVNIDQKSRYPIPDRSVDIIYSCAVLEHVHNLDLCFSEMARVLKDDGIMYHEVDLRDHIFSQRSIFFLSIPETWFRLFFSHTGGYVNRKRVSAYENLAKKYGFLVTNKETIFRYERADIPKPIRLRYSENDIRTLVFSFTLKRRA
jgi:SAM-dependent methyltransferase